MMSGSREVLKKVFEERIEVKSMKTDLRDDISDSPQLLSNFLRNPIFFENVLTNHNGSRGIYVLAPLPSLHYISSARPNSTKDLA
jgi:hypothetical protein